MKGDGDGGAASVCNYIDLNPRTRLQERIPRVSTLGELQGYPSFIHHVFIKHLLGVRHWGSRGENPDRMMCSWSS